MSNGYTLLELLLVIAIVAIVGVSSSAYTARFYSQNSVATTTDHLVSALRKAQFYSMMSKQNGGIWGVRYSTSPDKRITLFLQGNNSFDEHFQVKESVTISGFSEVTFTHALGLPSSTATTASPITIAGNGQSESLSVNSQGVVSKN